MNDVRYRTADDHEITDGLIVWDHNLRVSRVSFMGGRLTKPGAKYWDGWFEMRDPSTGAVMSSMNAKRMRFRHPYTGQRASEAAGS